MSSSVTQNNLGQYVRGKTQLVGEDVFSNGKEWSYNPEFNKYMKISPNYLGDGTTEGPMILEIDVQNGSNTGTVVPTPWLIQQIDVGLNNNNAAVQSLFPETIYSQLAFLYDEEYDKLASGMGLNGSFTGGLGVQLGPNATRVFYLPLFGCLAGLLDLRAVNNNVVLNVKLNPTPIASSVGSTSLTCTGMTLHMFSHQAPDETKLVKELRSKQVFTSNYFDSIYISNNVTLTAGLQNTINLCQINWQVAAFAVFVRANNSAANNGYTSFMSLGGVANGSSDRSELYTDSGLLDLQNAARVSLLGTGLIRGDLIRGPISAGQLNSSLTSLQPMYFWSFAEKPSETITKQQMNGGIATDSQLSLVIQPPSTFASGTYNVLFVGFGYRSAIIDTDGTAKAY